jgi:hypothetical protein
VPTDGEVSARTRAVPTPADTSARCITEGSNSGSAPARGCLAEAPGRLSGAPGSDGPSGRGRGVRADDERLAKDAMTRGSELETFGAFCISATSNVHWLAVRRREGLHTDSFVEHLPNNFLKSQTELGRPTRAGARAGSGGY